jgi:hypothetical protein
LDRVSTDKATPIDKENPMNADLEHTTEAILAADQAHLMGPNEGVVWERSGLLGRLTRNDRWVDAWWRRVRSGN